MSQPKRFADLLVELRGKRTQEEFGLWLGVSRSLVSNAEAGRRPGPTLLGALIKRFPHHKAAIEDSFAASFPTTPGIGRQSPKTHETPILVRARDLLAQGRQGEAVAALRAALDVLADPEEIVRTYRLLGDAWYSQGDDVQGEDACRSAIALAASVDLAELETGLRDHLAGRLTRQGRIEDALGVVGAGLDRHHGDWVLWRRRGIIYWHAHQFADAYASLTTALEFGCPRQRAIHSRAQVLAEWGHFSEALPELDEAIENAATPLVEAYARNTRAFAYGCLGDLERALSEFAIAEHVESDSAWLHYFRARCYDRHGDMEQALAGYRHSLKCKSPPLNGPKLLFVQARLNEATPRQQSI